VTLADVRFTHSGRVVVAQLTGEVDISNADSLRTAITEATPNESLGLVLDLSEIDYLDSAGIQLIYQLRSDLRARGQSLRLVIPSTSPARDALRLAGVERHLETVETIDAALRDFA
jgi:anti-sigma B factor antagonist